MSDLLRFWLAQRSADVGLGDADPGRVLDPRLLAHIVHRIEEHEHVDLCDAVMDAIARGEPAPGIATPAGRHVLECDACALVILERLGTRAGLLDSDQADLLQWVAEPLLDRLAEQHPAVAHARAVVVATTRGTAVERVFSGELRAGRTRARRAQKLKLGQAAASEVGGGRTVGFARVDTGAPARGLGGSADLLPSLKPAAAPLPLRVAFAGPHLLLLGPGSLAAAPPPGFRLLARACALAQVPLLGLAPSAASGVGGLALDVMLATAERVRAEVGQVWGWDECFDEPLVLLVDPAGRRGSIAWRAAIGHAPDADPAVVAQDLARLAAGTAREATPLSSPLWACPARPFWMPEDTQAFLARFGPQREGRLDPSSEPWRAFAPWLSAEQEAAPPRGGVPAALDALAEPGTSVWIAAPAESDRSTAVRHWAARQAPDTLVLARFFADDPPSSVDAALESLWREVTARCGVSLVTPRGPLALRDGLRSLLEVCGRQARLLLVLDGLDALDPALLDLDWIPTRPPAGVRVVASFSTGTPAAERLIARLQAAPGTRLLATAAPAETS
jgi:hypothetical protein